MVLRHRVTFEELNVASIPYKQRISCTDYRSAIVLNRNFYRIFENWKRSFQLFVLILFAYFFYNLSTIFFN